MQIESLVGSHVFDLQTEKYLGKIKCPVINYQDKKVLGFIYKRTFYSLLKAFPLEALKKAEGDFVIIEREKSKLLYRQKQIRKTYKQQLEVITLKLIEDDKQIAQVVDFEVDIETGKIKTLLAEKGLLSDIFRIPVDKVERFDIDAYVLKKDAVPKEEKEKPGLLTRFIAGAAKKVGKTAKQSKELYSEGQKNMLIGQTSPCKILSDKNEVILDKDQEITEEILNRLSTENKLGELSAAVVGSGIGTKIKTYKNKKKK